MADTPNENAAPAILARDTDARLDAIVRRHGGKPKSTKPVKPEAVFPPIGHRDCGDDQLTIDDLERS